MLNNKTKSIILMMLLQWTPTDGVLVLVAVVQLSKHLVNFVLTLSGDILVILTPPINPAFLGFKTSNHLFSLEQATGQMQRA